MLKPKEKLSFKNRLKSAGDSFLDYFRSHDDNGHPINLHFQGSDTFQTIPGGLLSLSLKVILISYGLIQFYAMFHRQNWQIIQ